MIEEDAPATRLPATRGHGWEYIQNELPGITQGDIDRIIRAPGKFTETEDGYRIIDDNPVGEGDLIVKIIDGIIIRASQVDDEDDREGRNLDIPESVVEKILNERKDWDHDQIGDSKQEIRETLKDIVDDPDEIWKQPGRDRWMYVKQKTLKGDERIVTLFTFEGEVRTAFVPTERSDTDEDAYSDQNAKEYIKDQNMIKENEYRELIEDVDEGEQA